MLFVSGKLRSWEFFFSSFQFPFVSKKKTGYHTYSMVTRGSPLPPVFGDCSVLEMNSISQVNSRWDISLYTCKLVGNRIRFPGHMLDPQGQQFSSDIG